MKTAIIVDDEPDCVRLLALQLRMSCPQVEVVGEYTSAEEALKNLLDKKPSILFLDIEMPRMNGFQLLEALGEINFAIVFVTAYDRFAIRAFRFSAVDYLLKPIDTKELQKAVQKAERLTRADPDQLGLLRATIGQDRSLPEKIALPYQNGVAFVEVARIVYCEADNNYSRFVLDSGEEHVVSKTLREVQEVMEGKTFLRVHRQYVVNLNHIKKFVRGEGNYLVMTDNKSIPVSRTHREQLIQRFGWL